LHSLLQKGGCGSLARQSWRVRSSLWLKLGGVLPRKVMKDVLPDIEKWRARGERVAVATVVRVVGSAPRHEGAKLAVSEKGEIAGSVSGGCVEPAVIQEALQVIRSGVPKMLSFGISAEDNLAQIGLSCGGEISVFVEPLNW
jgi:xanthine/CO dehydrogenase XdhC/CoxF family maturation factor